MNFKRCTSERNDPHIVVEENGRKFIIQNKDKKTVKIVTVDDCLIHDTRIRCDYLFEITLVGDYVIYLELKGSDVEHAYNQISATIGYCSTRHKSCKKLCYIVASRVPRAGPKVQALKVKMARKHNALLNVGTQVALIKI
jgi:hypothetical protein